MPAGTLDSANVHTLAEESFFQRMEEAAAGTLATDASGVIVWMDDKYGMLLGADPNKLIGKHISEVLPTSRIQEVLDTGKAIPLDLMRYPEGWRVVSRFPLLDTNGTVLGAFGFVLFTSPAKIAGMVHRYNVDAQARSSKAPADAALHEIADFLGSSRAALGVRAMAQRASQLQAPVLISGPSGTGKGLLAQGIHRASARHSAPFTKVTCESIADVAALDAALGEKPGANNRARGKVAPAEAGTLFFDHVEKLSLGVQAWLLRQLDARPRNRVIASTRADLRKLCAARQFLPELYWFLEAISIDVPPLHERPEDVGLLAERYLAEVATVVNRRINLSPSGRSLLQRHDLPGNARQLRHAIFRVALAGDSGELSAEDLTQVLASANGGTPTLSSAIEGAEQLQIEQALASRRGNVTAAARDLGISRTTLYKKARSFGILPTPAARGLH